MVGNRGLRIALQKILSVLVPVACGPHQEGLRGVQRVVVVLEPGPLGGHLGRWEAARQTMAEKTVQQAVARFFRSAMVDGVVEENATVTMAAVNSGTGAGTKT